MTEETKTEDVSKLTNETQVEEKQYTPDEQKALQLGWKDLDTWVEEGNDPKDHRSAKDFNERGDMIGKLRAQERELQQQRAALEHLTKQQKTIYVKGYETAIRDLKTQREQALEEGDFKKAEQIRDQIDETKEKLEAAVKAPDTPKDPEVDPTFFPWLEANPWYQDRTMQKFADALAIEYVAEARRQGRTPNNGEVRDFVTKTVKEEFAHRFKPSERKVTGAPNPDGEGRVSGKEKSNTETIQLSKMKAQMTEDQRSIMKTIMKASGLSEAEYLKMYAEVN